MAANMRRLGTGKREDADGLGHFPLVGHSPERSYIRNRISCMFPSYPCHARLTTGFAYTYQLTGHSARAPNDSDHFSPLTLRIVCFLRLLRRKARSCYFTASS